MKTKTVAPYTGAWIEIAIHVTCTPPYTPSLPIRERGLKSEQPHLAV